MSTEIKIPVDYLTNEDGTFVVDLFTETQIAATKEFIAGLPADDPLGEAQQKIERYQAMLDQDAELRAHERCVHAVYCFRRPTSMDRTIIRTDAFRQASLRGPVDSEYVLSQFERLARIPVLLVDTPGQPAMPDEIAEYVALELERQLSLGVDVRDFLSPKPDASPASKKRKA